MEVASIWSFHERPNAFYDWIRPVIAKIGKAKPNGAHQALAEMERMGCIRAVITQNIDSLHQEAGNQRVFELHGHTRTAICLTCGTVVEGRPLWQQVMHGAPAPRCQCGGLYKPETILFGEPLPYELLSEAQQEALKCDVMLVIGTSLEVMPAGDLPWLAQRRGARVIMINRQPTFADDKVDVLIRADVVAGLQQLLQLIR